MLANLKIGPRIYLSYAFAALVLVALGVFATVQLRSTTQSVQWLASDLGAYVEAVSTLESDVGVLTAHTRARIQGGGEAAATRADAQFATVRESLSRIEDLQARVAAKGVEADLAGWAEAIDRYAALFQEADDLVAQNVSAEKAFRTDGQRIANIAQDVVRDSEEAALEAIYGESWRQVPQLFQTVTQFSGVQSLILRARLMERQFVAQRSFAELDAFEKRLDTLERILGRLGARATGARAETIAQAESALADYRGAAETWIANARELEDLKTQLAEQSSTLIADAQQTAAAARDRAAAVGEATVAAARQTVRVLAGTAGGTLLLLAAVGVLVARGIVPPLNRLRGGMVALADGDLDVSVDGKTRRDEIGEMARAVEVFRDKSQQARDLEQRNRETEQREAEARARMLTDLADRLSGRVENLTNDLRGHTQSLRAAADTLSTNAAGTAEKSTSTSEAVRRTAAQIGTIASAAEQLRQGGSEISAEIGQNFTSVEAASESANQSAERVQSLVSSANDIGDVLQLITDIADKTNLLALNATIEAARAGEAGKGFAVVANEVKSLASQTRNATQQISEYVARIQADTDDAARGMHHVAETVAGLRASSDKVAEAVRQQNEQVENITESIEAVNRDSTAIAEAIGSVDQMTGETNRAAEEVGQIADGLNDQSDTVARQLNAFAADIRESATTQARAA